jgi:hypothetical protein
MRNWKLRTLVATLFLIYISLWAFRPQIQLMLTGFANVNTSETRIRVDPDITVIYTEFTGNTSDFDSMTNDELRNISDMILENPSHGRIWFAENVNIGDSAVDLIVDLDYPVNISHNRIEVNATNMSALNKSAMLYLYNLGFNDPMVMRNGAACPASLCQEVSYTGGTFMFTVNGLDGVYYAAETPTQPPEETPGGGIGGGVGRIYNFTVDKEILKVKLRQGETVLEYLEITNNGDDALEFELEVINGIKDYITLSEREFVLEKGQSRMITVAFTLAENGHVDVYSGRIVISAGPVEKYVIAIMEVRERTALFDIQVDLGDVPLIAYPGDQVSGNIYMYNFGDLQPVDVELFYSLRDFDGNDLLFNHETMAITQQKAVVRKIRIPDDIEPEYYLFYASLKYDNQTVTSSGLIRVSFPGEREIFEYDFTAILIGLIIIIVAVVLHVLLREREKRLWRKLHYKWKWYMLSRKPRPPPMKKKKPEEEE